MTSIDMLNKDHDYKVIRIWETVKGGMPEKFEAVLLHYSVEKKDIEIAKLEWSEYKTIESIDSFCICSQKIELRYYVINRHNKNILRIGSECIIKFLNEEVGKDIKMLKSHRRYEKHGDGSHRMCNECNRYSIGVDEPDWKKTCKSCFKKVGSSTKAIVLLKGRNCISCLKSTISPDEPAWKTKCSECYKKEKDFVESSEETDEEEFRQCSKCKKFNIKDTEPEWKKTCLNCYKKKDASDENCEYRKCSVCKLDKIKDTEPNWKKKCTSCFAKTK